MYSTVKPIRIIDTFLLFYITGEMQLFVGEHQRPLMYSVVEPIRIIDKFLRLYITGEMQVFVGGQQPSQRTSAPSNVLSASFMLQ